MWAINGSQSNAKIISFCIVSINLFVLFQKKKTEAEVQISENASDAKEDKENRVITLRPINMDDMRQAKSQVFTMESFSLQLWEGTLFVSKIFNLLKNE